MGQTQGSRQAGEGWQRENGGLRPHGRPLCLPHPHISKPFQSSAGVRGRRPSQPVVQAALGHSDEVGYGWDQEEAFWGEK